MVSQNNKDMLKKSQEDMRSFNYELNGMTLNFRLFLNRKKEMLDFQKILTEALREVSDEIVKRYS